MVARFVPGLAMRANRMPTSEEVDVTQYPTSLGVATPEGISLFGLNLTTDLIGTVSFGHLAYRLITLQEPSPQQTRVFEAVLVALADHGFTPTAIAARLTYLSAPDTIQGALAAGLLGGGSRFLGASEDTGAFLAAALAQAATPPGTEDEYDALARSAIAARRASGGTVPGLGHHLHKNGDPRTAVLIAIAREEGQYGPHLALFEAVGRMAPEVLGRSLPLNGAGTCGAVLADLGLPLPMLRGVVLLARCAGLLGHLSEEIRRPLAADIFHEVEANAVYVDPAGPQGP